MPPSDPTGQPVDEAALAEARRRLQSGDLAAAESIFEKIRSSHPGHFETLYSLAIIRAQSNDLDAAQRHFGEAARADPEFVDAHFNRGVALGMLDRHAQALDCYDRTIALAPDHAEAWNNRGATLYRLARFDDCVASCDHALALAPRYPQALNNRGMALREMTRFAAALETYERALAMAPGSRELIYNRAVVLLDLHRLEEAISGFDRCIALKPDYAEAWNNRGGALFALKRYASAIECYTKALALKPDLDFLPGDLFYAQLQICDWRNYDAQAALIQRAVIEERKTAIPFLPLIDSDSPQTQRRAAEIWAASRYGRLTPLSEAPAVRRGARMRIGYFSADFRQHAVAYLIAELFERHDASKFELFGYGFGPPADDHMRQRIAGAFEHFFDVGALSDREVAQLAREHGLDVAVDLNGYTQDCRPGVFALRAAPVQVNYLGYPGTMGAGFMDYLIADPIVIPPGHERYYTEKIVRMPHAYQANCATHAIDAKHFSRTELGLPEHGFVYCCFNASNKINPAMFAHWMRILGRVDQSVLWLFESNAAAAVNLRAAAASHGVDPARLIFAARTEHASHLARHRAADLFLDTLPYNAHTTASDALRAGLPLLTCLGETFAGRVAASLLNAVGLPELVAVTLRDYEAQAVALSTDGEQLRELRDRLAAGLRSAPLFDAARFTSAIEAAFIEMIERSRKGDPPEHFSAPGPY